MSVYDNISDVKFSNYQEKYIKNNNVAHRGTATAPKQLPSMNSSTESDSIEISTNRLNSSRNLYIGALATLTALIGGCALAGKGNPIKGAKEIYNWVCKKLGFCKNSIEKEVSTTLTARRVNGKNIYTIPGQKTTITGENQVAAYANDNGIHIGKARIGYHSDTSRIDKCEFYYPKDWRKCKKTPVKVIFRRDEKFDILDEKGKSVLEAWTKSPEHADDLNKIIDLTTKIGEGKVKGNYSAFKDLRNVEYTNDLGDDVFNISRSGVEARLDVVGGPRHSRTKVTKMTTLKRYEEDSDAVKKYFEEHPEFKEKFSAEALKSGKLPDGMQVGKFTKVIDGKVFYFENGEVKGILITGKNTIGVADKDAIVRLLNVPGKGVYYPKGSKKYEEILGAESKSECKAEVERLIKNVYTDKTVIPEGATIYVK